MSRSQQSPATGPVTAAAFALVASLLLPRPSLAAITFLEEHRQGENGVFGLVHTQGLIVSPDGRHVYVLSAGDSQSPKAIAIFSRDPATGRLTWLAVQRETLAPLFLVAVSRGIAFSPDGRSLYAPQHTTNEVYVYSRDAASGRLAFLGAVRDGVAGVDGIERPVALVVSPDGRSVYVASDGGANDDPGVAYFARSTASGALTFRTAYREDSLEGPFTGVWGIAIAPDGRDVYVIGERSLVRFARSTGSGSLQLGEIVEDGPLHPLFRPRTILVTPDGRHVLTSDGSDVQVFMRDSTGELRLLGATRLERSSVNSVHADPRGDQIYAIGAGGANALARDLSTGLLAMRDSVGTDDLPGFASYGTASPDGRNLYFVDVSPFDGDALGVFDTGRPTAALLQRNRFRVFANFASGAGSGRALPVVLTPDTAYFWFFSPENVEVVIKILDGCGLNGRFWVFLSGLTSVEVELTVTDTATGVRKQYRNPAGATFTPRLDTGAFATCP